MFDAIVLAGGSARRLDGVDKPAVRIAGATLLELVLRAVQAAGEVVVVGPPRRVDVARPVTWCREQPAGGGPVAALATALPLTAAARVVVLAADLPSVGPAVPVLLDAVTPGTDLALLVDPDGRRNPLAAAWRRAALVTALRGVGDPHGAAVRSLVGRVDAARVAEVADRSGWGADCDTWDDVARARAAAAARPDGG